jgi:molecular chaperone HtpG
MQFRGHIDLSGGASFMAKQTQSFNAEIKQLLDLMIHSLYSHKEIFLRELISNGSDAIDKLKFESLTQPQLVPAGHEYQIRLEADSTAKTLKIIDSGVGMNKDEVVEFIGTIARSGTKKFAQLNDEIKKRPELIGQFGVGFYSAFMVADKVTLHTQKAGSNSGVIWESTGDGTYSIDEVPRPLGTGTTITLHLKSFESEEEVQDFTDTWVLKSLVKKYSDFIAYPIVMKTSQLVKDETDDKEKDKEPKYEEKDEILNSQKALWLKSPSEVTEEEYKEFYKHLTHDWNEPLKHNHYRAEGTMEFSALLYLPTKKPWNYNTKETEYGLSLFVKRVFIMANCKDLLPSYLRFVKGMVDSSDLSLNVSRELLQQDRQVIQIRKNVVNKVFSMLKDLLTKERSQYENFWTEFGATLKEGVPTDTANKEKIQDLLLFHTTSSDKMTTVEEYVGRMKETQKEIYFIAGDSLSQVSHSPYLEKLKEKNYEVLLLVDPVDEWVTEHLREYKGKKLQSITKAGLDLDTAEEKQSKEESKKLSAEKFKPLLETLKKSLANEVKDIVISDRLTETPVCLVSDENDPSAHMQKILSQMGSDYKTSSKRILEINPQHPLFERMLGLTSDEQTKWGEILYGQALLTEGSTLPDPVKFSRQVADLMIAASGGKVH